MNKSSITKYIIGALAIVFSIAAPVILADIYWTSVLILIGINVLLTSSLRVIGLIGHISLGHVGFMLVGAYTSSLLVMKADVPFGFALFASGGLAGTLALILGYPFLRVKGIYFAILTLLTAESLRLLAFNWRNLTGGPFGLMSIPAPGPISISGLGQLQFETAGAFYYLMLTVVGTSLLVLYRFERSRIGFIWQAIRETDKLASAVGVNTLFYKILNFSIGCFFAGMAGSLFAHFHHGLSADTSSTFGVLTSIYLLIYMVVGGENQFSGPIVGALVLSLLSEFARPLQEYQPVMIGAIAIIVVLLLPKGLASLPANIGKWAKDNNDARIAAKMVITSPEGSQNGSARS